jgi:hypothetical protein
MTPEVLAAYLRFRKAHPATRVWRQFDGETRANLAWARTGYKRRQATGEFYYTHPLCPSLAFPTAKAATLRAFELTGGVVRVVGVACSGCGKPIIINRAAYDGGPVTCKKCTDGEAV